MIGSPESLLEKNTLELFQISLGHNNKKKGTRKVPFFNI